MVLESLGCTRLDEAGKVFVSWPHGLRLGRWHQRYIGC